jgi:hypothetical protein
MGVRREHIERDSVEAEDVVAGAIDQAKAPFAVAGVVDNQFIQLGGGVVSGGTSSGANVTTEITFPKAFPNACDFVVVTITNIPTGYVLGTCGVTATSSTGMTVALLVHTAPGSPLNILFSYLAIGH